MKKQYQGILADLDGTVNRGNLLVAGAEITYRCLSSKGVRWVFVSNSATRLASDLADKINGLGLPVAGDQVINSATALIHALEKDYSESRVMVVGEPRLIHGLKEAGVSVTQDPKEVDIVAVAMDFGFTYDKLRKAYAAIQNGATFWATNLDPTFPADNGFLPGAGCIVASIATAAGHPPDRVFGKPFPDMAQLALKSLRISAESCLVVGDRMDTDILFARNAGMDSALVLSGATSRADLEHYPYSPDYVFESIVDLIGLFD